MTVQLEAVERYYSEKLRLFGPTPRGVDWKSAESQTLRFDRLLQVMEKGDRVPSLNDYGCGYGALAEYLGAAGPPVAYRGFDISEPMIAAARTRQDGAAWCSFTSDPSELRPADYTLASGIFNVKLGHATEPWREYVAATLEILDALSLRGFAFNMLSGYSDADKQRDDLYYADPLTMFDLCKRRFSPRVALLHDYPLFEFTLIVRK